MSSVVIIGLSAICCISGFILNSLYTKKYGEPAIRWKLCILQCSCVAGVLSHMPGDELSFRFLFWIIAAAVSYAAGLWKCREHAKQQGAGPGDIAGAMTAQAVFPAGVTLAVMMVAGMFIFGFLWAH